MTSYKNRQNRAVAHLQQAPVLHEYHFKKHTVERCYRRAIMSSNNTHECTAPANCVVCNDDGEDEELFDHCPDEQIDVAIAWQWLHVIRQEIISTEWRKPKSIMYLNVRVEKQVQKYTDVWNTFASWLTITDSDTSVKSDLLNWSPPDDINTWRTTRSQMHKWELSFAWFGKGPDMKTFCAVSSFRRYRHRHTRVHFDPAVPSSPVWGPCYAARCCVWRPQLRVRDLSEQASEDYLE